MQDLQACTSAQFCIFNLDTEKILLKILISSYIIGKNQATYLWAHCLQARILQFQIMP